MDELFDRLKSIKIKRRILVISLILTEILGIFVLVWYLRVPLSQKFLVVPPNSYSVASFESQKQYLLTQGDYLTGQTTPSSTVKVLINPSNIQSSILADSDGNWSYQIPEDLPLNTYTVTVVSVDISSQIQSQSYKFRVQSNLKLNKLLN